MTFRAVYCLAVVHVRAHPVAHHAASSPSESFNWNTIFGIVIVIGVVSLIVAAIKYATPALRVDGEAPETLKEHLEALAFQPIPTVAAPVGLLLSDGERAYYSSQADVLGEHTTTRRVGGSTGPSLRIARGVYWRASAFASKPVRQTYTQVDDTGTFTVTNKRAIFIGRSKNVNLALAKILSTEPYTDGLLLNPERGRSVVLRTGSQDAWFILERGRLGSLDKLIPQQVAPT